MAAVQFSVISSESYMSCIMQCVKVCIFTTTNPNLGVSPSSTSSTCSGTCSLENPVQKAESLVRCLHGLEN